MNTKPEKPVRAVQLCHELLRWVLPRLDHFPRSRRFTLGQRIETGLLDVLGSLINATYSKRKTHALAEANQQLAVVRHLWRLCFELKVLDQRRYLFGAELLVTLGKQIGGWQRHVQNA